MAFDAVWEYAVSVNLHERKPQPNNTKHALLSARQAIVDKVRVNLDTLTTSTRFENSPVGSGH